MKKISTLLILFLQTMVLAQDEYAWVYFNDKPNQQVFLDNPLSMLTQKALDRRIKQQLPLDIKDVPIHGPYVKQVKETPGITIVTQSKWLNTLYVKGVQDAIKRLKELPFVARIDFADKLLNNIEEADIDRVGQVKAFKNTKDDFEYGESATQIEMLNGQVLHQQDYIGKGMIIGVIDSGFSGVNTASPFRRIRENNQILGTYNVAYRNKEVYAGSDHGTKVLSIIAAYEKGKLIGTAPDASFYLFRVSHPKMVISSMESYLVAAIEMADSLGVNVINLSQGISQQRGRPNYGYTYKDMDGKTTFISRGAEIAFSRGMLVVTSAGNEGSKSWKYITAPADAAHVLSVGAVSTERIRAPFSSQGPTADGRIKPDVMALGHEVMASDKNGSINYEMGTSFSSPIIAGLVACLWQALPDKTNEAIRKLILQASDHYTNPDGRYGYGIPNFQLAFHNATLTTDSFTVNGFAIYPNPTETNLTIAASGQHDARFIMYNSLGQEVIRQKVNELQETIVPMENLKSGMYLYTIVSGKATRTGKIIKR